jgi:signal peptidase I
VSAEANPYASMPAVADGEEDRSAPRWLAVVVSLFAVTFSGAGLLLLGRRRRALAWTVGGLVAGLPMMLSIPRLLLVSLVLHPLVHFAGMVATAVSAKGPLEQQRRPYLVALLILLAAFGFFVIRRTWLMQAFQMPSGSMLPTLLIGDKILVDKTVRAPGRGDVIVFQYPQEPSVEYIKRVIGLPGETVAIREGAVFIEGKPLDRRLLDVPCASEIGIGPSCQIWEERAGARTYQVAIDGNRRGWPFESRIPAGHYFVLGDNRDNSNDSRVWGPLPAKLVRGRVTSVWYSQEPNEGDMRWGRTGAPVE